MWTKILSCFRKKQEIEATKMMTGRSLPPKREFYIQPLLPLDFQPEQKKA